MAGEEMDTILPTTLVGSYPRPDWLIDRANLAGRFPPRVRAKELWRIAPERLEQAQDDATLIEPVGLAGRVDNNFTSFGIFRP
jgi:hypothetical protein